MKKLALIIIAFMTATFVNAEKQSIKVVINGEEVSLDTIPQISYYDNCSFSLIGETANESTQWETRIALDCNSATSAYQIYNPLKGNSYLFCLEELDETISLPETESGLVWEVKDGYVNATITANTSKGWVYSIPVKLKLIPEAPIVDSFEVSDIIYTESNEDNEIFGCKIKMTWNTPDFPVKPMKVITKTTNNYYNDIRPFDAPGYGEYLNEGAFDHDIIEIYSENRYGKSVIQRFAAKNFANVENITINNPNSPQATFRDGNIVITGLENSQPWNLSLHSISGSKISETSDECDNAGSIIWGIDAIEMGIYILSISNNNKFYSFKIYKNN